jgi:hypothetical protein
MKNKETQDKDQLLTQLISLLDDERLIRLQKRAEKKGYGALADMLKVRRKTLEEQSK